MSTNKGKGTKPAQKLKQAKQPPDKQQQLEPVLPAQAAAPQTADSTPSFPIVGIGASAGGLAAFQAFFSAMPADSDPGMAFVLVQHLDPNHESILAELIRRHTRMPVCEAEDGAVLKVNCVYIIPPNHDMAILNGAIQLLNPSKPRGQRLPIDYFFRSLAQDQRENSVGIVLSGTGSDGTLGVRAIKGEGGMVMGQAPDTTEFDGMPRSAIATGLADFVLEPAKMPAQLIAYAALASKKLYLPVPAVIAPQIESALSKVFVLLRAQTGHDFSLYKPNTIIRRIERRKALHQIETMEDYVKFLEQTPPEVEALFREILIGVTSFFRDPQAFDALEKQLNARLLEGMQANGKVRVWAPGCSTGEEAYSIAMVLHERMEALKQNYAVQIFATDIDSRAIVTARMGRYPASIAADVTAERLNRFFTLESGGYLVRRAIRDMVTFSEQDVIKDPPFSQLDLISCRNLLIYLRGELQDKLFQLFHYALNPGGMLFLGTSEGIGETQNLFAVLDGKARLFQRRGDARRETLGTWIPPMTGRDPAIAPRPATLPAPARRSLGEQTEQALLQLLAPACALVEKNGDILHLRGRTGMYLEPSPGDAGINNILKMAREGLAQDLKLALHQAAEHGGIVRRAGLSVRTNGSFAPVNLTVCPVVSPAGQVHQSIRYLVVLEEAPVSEAKPVQPSAAAGEPGLPADARIAGLEQELRAKEKLLRTAGEDADTTNEELRSALEEMQSVNEELQSSNEELATSKEELQSVNEELATVNVEQQNKVAELARALNDNRNLLSGSGIATVFVDLHQRILSFTPAATAIINLVLTDVGRPVGHFMSNLMDYNHLAQDIASVLDTLIPKEIKVQDKGGRSYLLRIQPYRTLENVIEGAAIAFMDVSELVKAQVDIAELKKVQAALEEGELRYRSVVSALSEAVVLHARDGKIVAWNPAAERIFGLPGKQLQECGTFDPLWRTIHEDGSPFPRETCPSEEAFRTGLPQKDVVMGIYRPDGALAWISTSAMPIFEPGDASPATVVVSCIDITERKRIEESLNKASEDRRLAVVVRDAHDAITLQGLDGRILAWNRAAERVYGWSEAEALQMNAADRIPPESREDALSRLIELSQAKTLEPYRTQRLAKDGVIVDVSITASALRDEAGQVYAIATTERLIRGGSDD